MLRRPLIQPHCSARIRPGNPSAGRNIPMPSAGKHIPMPSAGYNHPMPAASARWPAPVAGTRQIRSREAGASPAG